MAYLPSGGEMGSSSYTEDEDIVTSLVKAKAARNGAVYPNEVSEDNALPDAWFHSTLRDLEDQDGCE